MPKPQLKDVMSVIRDPMVSDHFTLEIPLVPTGSSDAETLMVQCQSATKPGETIDEVAVALFGHTVVYAGRKVFNHDLNVTFVENVRGTIVRMLEKWAEIIRGSETQHGAFKQGGDGYAKDGKLTIWDNKGEAVLIYAMYNMWPATIPETQYDGTASNLITHAVGFKFDWYERIGGYTQ